MLAFKKGHKPHNKGKKGFKHTEETRRKMSESKKGKGFSEETRRKMSEVHKGKTPWNKEKTGVYSKESLEKMSIAKKGKPISETHKIHLHKLHSFWKGGKHSEEAKRKMRGRVISDETRKRMSGRVISDETRKKLGAGRKGIKASKETLEKMSIARSKQVFPRKDTKGERILQDLCKNAGITFLKHKNFNLGFQRHQVDLFIKPNICLESDGDYTHANPNNYKRNGKIYPGYQPERIIYKSKYKITRAKDRWDLDKKIDNGLKSQGNIVIRFWESELEENPKKCLKKIIKRIRN